jgi:hypothetical protein
LNFHRITYSPPPSRCSQSSHGAASLPWRVENSSRTPSPASSHGALHSVPSPLFFPVRPGKHPSLFPFFLARQSTLLFPAPYSPMETSRSSISSMAGVPHSASAQLPLPKQRAPFLAVFRSARWLFDKMRSKPRAAAALPFDLHSPRRVSSLSCSLCSPIRDAVETRGPRENDRASDVVPLIRCSRWTTQGRMDITSGCSPSKYLPQQTLSKC